MVRVIDLEFTITRLLAGIIRRRRYRLGLNFGAETEVGPQESGDEPVSYRMPVGFRNLPRNTPGHDGPGR